MFEAYNNIIDKIENPQNYEKTKPKSYKNTLKYFKVTKLKDTNIKKKDKKY